MSESHSLDAFSAEGFNEVAWINDLIAKKPVNEAVEPYLASLSLRLHLASEDYTDHLETSMVDVMSSTPRLLSDSSRIKDVLQSFEEEMGNLSAQLRTFDQRNVAGVEDLSRLDTLKSNMEKCKSTLEEHAQWKKLVQEARSFMEGGGRLSESADRIEVLYSSASVLQLMPGHKEREQVCKDLSEALLKALRPRVRKDVAGTDLSQLGEYIYVYSKLQRKVELETEYVKARPDRLRADSVMPANAAFGQWLATFYGKVAGLVLDEEKNVSSIFGEERVPDILCHMLQSCMRLISGAGAVISSSSQAGQSPQLAQRQSRSTLEAALFKGAAQQPFLEGYAVTEEFSRRVFGLVMQASPDVMARSLEAVYGPFWDGLPHFMAREATVAAAAFSSSLEQVVLSAIGAPDDDSAGTDTGTGTGAGVGATNADPFDVLERFTHELIGSADQVAEVFLVSLQRCAPIFAGYRLQHILSTLVDTLATHIQALATRTDELHHALGVGDRHGQAPSSSSSSSSSGDSNSGSGHVGNGHRHAQKIYAQLRAEGADAGMVGKARDLLPYALRCLQAAGRMTARLRTIDGAVVKAVGDIRQQLQLHDAVAAKAGETGSTVGGGGEVVSFGGRFALQRVRGDGESLAALQTLLQAGPESEGKGEGCTWHLPALTPAYEAVDRFTNVAGSLMLEVCTLLPRKVLSDVGDDAAWGARGGGGDEDDSDLLPGTAFTHVGEHLLSLVQELEAFAASAALQDLLHVSVRARSNFLEGLTAASWVGAVGGGVAADGLHSLAGRGAATAAVHAVEAAVLSRTRTDSGEDGDRDGGRGRSASSASVAAAALRPEDIEAGGEAAELAALGLANEWLGAMADTIAGLVLAQILRIAKLSALGRRQLDTDVAYLRNVVAAIGLAPHPVLEHLSQLLSAVAVGADGTKAPSLLRALDAMGATTLAEMALKEVDRKVVVSFV